MDIVHIKLQIYAFFPNYPYLRDMKKWILFIVLATAAFSAYAQGSFKVLVNGKGETVKEAGTAAAFESLLHELDFAKAVTNIDLWNVPLKTKFTFEDKWGPSAFELGVYMAMFLLPQDGSDVIYQVGYDPATYSNYSLE